MTVQPLLRVTFRMLCTWQIQAVLLSGTIILMLLFLGDHEDPYALVLRLERERQQREQEAAHIENQEEEKEGLREARAHSKDNEEIENQEVESVGQGKLPQPQYDVLTGVERAFGYLYQDIPRVFYNRVPKAGSRSVIRMLNRISRLNEFHLIQSKLFLNYTVSPWEERELVRNITGTAGPVLFERHIHFVDFTRHQEAPPVYINMINEPATRLASWYYFIRFNRGHVRNMSYTERYRTYDECVELGLEECVSTRRTFQIIPFFCGQDEFCRTPSHRALLQAKRNVELYYAVVGVVADFKAFLSVLEVLLPTYFANVVQLYENREADERRYSCTVNKREPSTYTKSLLSQKLKHEYEFYYYIQQRFYRLVYLVKKMKRNSMQRRSPGELELMTD